MRVSDRIRILAFAIAAALAAADSHAQRSFPVSPLPAARNLHGTALVGDYLYAVSGDTPSGFTASVLSARVNPDRTLGVWAENRALPAKLIYIGNSVLAVGGVVIVVGGQEVEESFSATAYSKKPSNVAFFSRAGAAGTLGPWQKSAPWRSTASVGAAAVSDGKHIYVIGGQDASGAITGEVHGANIDPATGGPSTWFRMPDLPTPLWFHGAFHHNGAIYTVGGRAGDGEDTTTDRIFLSKIQSDGSLSSWSESPGRLAFPVNGASVCASDQYMFLFCGRTTGGELVERIQYAELLPDGITEWEAANTTLTARYYSSAVLDSARRAIYIVGGRYATAFTDINREVFCYPLAASAASGPSTSSGQIATPGFRALGPALAQGEREGKNILMVFYSANVQPSRKLAETLSASASFFTEINAAAVPVLLEVAEHGELVRRYEIVRAPTFVLTTPSGVTISTRTGILSQQEVVSFARGR